MLSVFILRDTNYILYTFCFHFVQKFRETVQNILRAAHAKGVASIAIPSLGVGNLHYPADVSARILFDEVMAFHARNPSPIQTFHFVIYQKQVYEAFNKEYVQLMTGRSTHQQVGSSSFGIAFIEKDFPVL